MSQGISKPYTKYIYGKYSDDECISIINNESDESTMVVLFSSGDDDIMHTLKEVIKTKYQDNWFLVLFNVQWMYTKVYGSYIKKRRINIWK